MRRLGWAVLISWAWARGALANGPAHGAPAVPAIPEPEALALFVLGVGVIGAAIRRRRD
jgi:hypothetical protein